MSVVTSVDFRPILSPKCPNTIPPSGRAKKPTAYVLNDAICAANGSSVDGKNSLSKTSAAAVPYRKKSYHSIDVPIKLATNTRVIDVERWALSLISTLREKDPAVFNDRSL